MVDVHRHRSAFEPELSLVAEVDGAVVGHALFSQRTIRLVDADVPAVSLGPIAVLPAYQRQGVGGTLIAEGHRVAAAKGCTVCYLIGHATYYPRSGYRTHADGAATVTVPTAELRESDLQATLSPTRTSPRSAHCGERTTGRWTSPLTRAPRSWTGSARIRPCAVWRSATVMHSSGMCADTRTVHGSRLLPGARRRLGSSRCRSAGAGDHRGGAHAPDPSSHAQRRSLWTGERPAVCCRYGDRVGSEPLG